MKRIFPLAALALMSTSALANNYFYMGMGDVGFAPANFKDSSLFSDPSFSIGGGHWFSEHFGTEGFFRYEESVANSELEELNYFNFGLSLIASTQKLGDTPFELFGRATAMSVYAKQYQTINGGKESIAEDTGALFNISGGVIWNLNSDYWLRAEYIYSVGSTGLGDFEADYDGIQISLGLDF